MKKIICSLLVMSLAVMGFATFVPTNASANETKVKQLSLPTTIATTQSVQNESITFKVTDEEHEIGTMGLKKDAVVYALKYGGSAVSKITELLSPSNAKLVKQYSWELGDALDRFSTSIEARLVDFMIFDLGFSQSAARSIAWAISIIAL